MQCSKMGAWNKDIKVFIPFFCWQLLEMLESYAQFEIDEITGEALTMHDRIDLHYDRVTALQVI